MEWARTQCTESATMDARRLPYKLECVCIAATWGAAGGGTRRQPLAQPRPPAASAAAGQTGRAAHHRLAADVMASASRCERSAARIPSDARGGEAALPHSSARGMGRPAASATAPRVMLPTATAAWLVVRTVAAEARDMAVEAAASRGWRQQQNAENAGV